MTGMNIHPLACGLGMAFLVEAPQGLLLVDSGSPGQQGRVLQKMKSLGRRDLKCIWITHAHYDHVGSAAALRQLTGASIGVHPADSLSLAEGISAAGTTRSIGWVFRLALPLLNWRCPLPATRPDFALQDGETLERSGFNLSVLHTPGHTPGHTCLLLQDEQDNIAFVGDLISSHGPRLQYLLASDWSQLQPSLAKFLACRPEWFYTGHSRRRFPLSSLLRG